MNYPLWFLLVPIVVGTLVDGTKRTIAEEPNFCLLFEEEDFRVESFVHTEQNLRWRITSLKRMEWSLQRQIRARRIGQRIDDKSVNNLAETFLPDPGSRFVDEIINSIRENILAQNVTRAILWSPIFSYRRVIRFFTPAVRDIVYAKILVQVRGIRGAFERELVRDREVIEGRIAAIKRNRNDTKECFQQLIEGMEKAKSPLVQQLIRYAVSQSRIEILRNLVVRYSPHSTTVWGSKTVSSDARRNIKQVIETIVSSARSGNELEQVVADVLKKLEKKWSLSRGDLGLVVLQLIDELAQFVAEKESEKRPELEGFMNTIQDMIDRSSAHLSRLDSFYA